MKSIGIIADPKKKQITFPVPSTSFVPDYLKYLLEYHKIPNTWKLCFTDKTYKNLEEFKNERLSDKT